MGTRLDHKTALRRDPAAPVSIPPLRALFGVDPGRFAHSALPGLALDGMGSALDRELSGADRCPAGCAYRQRVKLGSAGVLENDGLLSGVHVVVAPFLQREDDRTEVGAGFGQVVLVARWVFGVDASLEHADVLEPA